MMKTRAPAARRNNPQDNQYPRRDSALTRWRDRSRGRLGSLRGSRPAPTWSLLSPAHCQTPTSEDLMPDADDGPSPQLAARALATGSP